MNTGALLEAYSKSYFDEFVPADRLVTPEQKKAAAREYDANPAAALLENVEQSKVDLRDTAERLKRAQYDGLFDADGFKAASKPQKRQWISCIDIVRGDYQRAKSELAHWRGYVKWAMEEQAAKVARMEAQQPDRRLPPEPEEEIPF
jgi:hypothetical protein